LTEAFSVMTLGALSVLMLQGLSSSFSVARDAFSVLMLPGLKVTFLNLLAFEDLDDPVEPLLTEFFSVIALNTVFPGLFGLSSIFSVMALQSGLFAPLRTASA
jgi:hypothetical protein